MTTHRSSRTLNCCMRLEKAHPFQQQVILCRCRSHELARFTLLTARALFGHQLWTQLVRSTAPGEARTKAELKTNGTSFAPPILTNNFEPYLISRECAARLSHGDSTATSVSGRGDRFAVNGKLEMAPVVRPARVGMCHHVSSHQPRSCRRAAYISRVRRSNQKHATKSTHFSSYRHFYLCLEKGATFVRKGSSAQQQLRTAKTE